MHHHKNTTLHITEESRRNGSSYSSLGLQSTRLGASLFNGGTRIVCQATVELSGSHVSILAQHTEGW
jgi:hypothetical protein